MREVLKQFNVFLLLFPFHVPYIRSAALFQQHPIFLFLLFIAHFFSSACFSLSSVLEQTTKEKNNICTQPFPYIINEKKRQVSKYFSISRILSIETR